MRKTGEVVGEHIRIDIEDRENYLFVVESRRINHLFFEPARPPRLVCSFTGKLAGESRRVSSNEQAPEHSAVFFVNLARRLLGSRTSFLFGAEHDKDFLLV